MHLPNEQEKILIIDDDKDILQAYKTLLKQQNKQVYVCDNPLIADKMISNDWCGIAVIDIYMPYITGIELMEKIHQIDKQIPILLITGHGDIPMAVEAVKKGAYDFLEKPVDPILFIKKINQALENRTHYLAKKYQKSQQISEQLIGDSIWVKEIREKLLAYSLTTLPVYLYGPSGSGKLLAAKQLIPDKPNTNVKIYNLQQIEDVDKFENWVEQVEADNGILILQSIELLPKKCQIILIQKQTQPEKKFRLIVTSHTKPEQLATEQILLPEFYYLFSLTQLECLGLQQRKKDITILFEYYLKKACKRLSIKKLPITDLLKKSLNNRLWENNVSELINAAELYAVGIMPTKSRESTFHINKNLSLEQNVEEYEKNLIIKALDMYHGRINEAANYLQIPRKKLYLRMKKYQLNKDRFKY